MSVTQAGKVVKFLVALVVVALVVAVVMLLAAESQRMRDRVALDLLIFDQSLSSSQIPNQDQTLTALFILACSQSQIRAKI